MNMETSSEGLLGIRDLLTETWTVFRQRMKTLVIVTLALVLLPALTFAPIFGLSFLVSFSFPEWKGGITAVGTLMAVVAAVMVANWALSALLTAIVNEHCNMKDAFMRSKAKMLGHFWLAVLTGLLLTGAHLFFIIPGVILTVWFFFAPFVFMDEDVRGLNALLKSKSYVQGRWFPVALRLLTVWLIAALLSAVPVIGQLLVFVTMPFSLVYTFLLYKNLKNTQAEAVFRPTRREKMGVVAAGALGYALPVLLVFAFMGSMITLPFSVLTAGITDSAPVAAPMDKTGAHPRIVRAKPPKQSVSTRPAEKNDSPDYAGILTEPNKDWTKRAQAAFKLGASNNPKIAVPPLIHALENDDQWMVRKNAANALGKLRTQKALPLLIRVLESDENVFVREAAAEALGRLGDKQAVAPLRTALADTGVVMTQQDGETVEKKSVVKAARTALTQLGAEPMPDPLVKQQQMPVAEEARAASDRKDLKPAREGLPASPAKVETTALNQEEIGRLKGRISACTKAVKIQPEDALAYHHRALAHFKLGNHDEAIEDLTKALELTPKEALIYYNRAIVYADLGRYGEAIEDGTKSIKLDPDFADAYLNRGIDYLACGRVKEALADFQKLTQLKATDAAGYYGRGIAKLKLGSRNPAMADLETAADMGNEKAKRYLERVGVAPAQS